MDLGLYQLKYPVRRLIAGVLPLVRDVPPDAVSLAVLPVGLATAGCYAAAGRHPALLAVGAGLIGLRMFLATLDGLMAVTFGKSTRRGELMNRLPAEASDLLLVIGVAVGTGRPWLGLAATAACWAVSFAGLVGLTAAAPSQGVGPAGSTDRLAVLIGLSAVGLFVGGSVPVMAGFLWWAVVGGTVTVGLRLGRTWRACRPAIT